MSLQAASAVPAPSAAMLIALDTVDKTYSLRGGQTCHAIRRLSLRVPAGEYVAVLGKSGSGKSTLLNLIAGLDRTSGGSVTIGNVTLAQLSENAMAAWRGRHVGVVFQFFQLLPTLTTAENIILAMELAGKIAPAARRPRARELLELVGLADQADKLPSTLSGGQQQRAAIARALANDPPLLLADEPTGNLDTQTAADINALFEQLAARGMTLLVVTHDPNLARMAHRVVELRDGRIVSDMQREPAAA